jgi:hypothetical protein
VTDRPLLYLTLRSTQNRLRVRLRRLREPRYLIGLLLGLAYFSFLLWGRGRRGGASAVTATAGGNPIELGATAVLFVVAALAWVWPGSRPPALAFSSADVQFLFPARRGIHRNCRAAPARLPYA